LGGREGLRGVWRGVRREWAEGRGGRVLGLVGEEVGGIAGEGSVEVRKEAVGAREGVTVREEVTLKEAAEVAVEGGAGGSERPEEEEEGIKITLRGLASMQPADRAAVLYAPPVDRFGLLQAFCERVRDAFREAEVMEDEGRPLLLHATVVNTVYVKGDKQEGGSNARGRGGRGRGGRGGRGGKKWERLVFDATGIIDRYEDQVWMENVPVEKIAICRMGAKKVVVDGEEDEAYEVEAEVDF
jgi:activating signal cointegrator complex subunit 1